MRYEKQRPSQDHSKVNALNRHGQAGGHLTLSPKGKFLGS